MEQSITLVRSKLVSAQVILEWLFFCINIVLVVKSQTRCTIECKTLVDASNKSLLYGLDCLTLQHFTRPPATVAARDLGTDQIILFASATFHNLRFNLQDSISLEKRAIFAAKTLLKLFNVPENNVSLSLHCTVLISFFPSITSNFA